MKHWTPIETWPKYYTTMDSCTTTVAYIRRDEQSHYTIVKKDGTETPGFCWGEWDEGDRKEISEAEAKSLVRQSIANCPDCNEPLTDGHADVCPMAWIEIDVPRGTARVRRKYSQPVPVSPPEIPDNLPSDPLNWPHSTSPERKTVRLFIPLSDCSGTFFLNVVATGDDLSKSLSEIKINPTTGEFYVEE
jgi:hypothetical protein